MKKLLQAIVDEEVDDKVICYGFALAYVMYLGHAFLG